MRNIFVISFLFFALVSCTDNPMLSEYKTEIPLSTPTKAFTPRPTPSVTLSKTLESSPTPDPAIQVLVSPNGNLVAKLYTNSNSSRPSLEKPVIEISDKRGMLLWQIPYPGEISRSYPQPSFSIYKWANDNSALYFFEGFSYDGYITLWDGFNLQKVDIKTGMIEKVVPGTELMAFAFSPDEYSIAYARNQATQLQLVIRNLATKSEKSVRIDIKSEKPIQVGWISWSPNGEKVLFHVETKGQVWAFYLDTTTMTQKELLNFVLEKYWFDSWSQDNKPQYIDYYKNISVVDVETGKLSMVGTTTPTPSFNP